MKPPETGRLFFVHRPIPEEFTAGLQTSEIPASCLFQEACYTGVVNRGLFSLCIAGSLALSQPLRAKSVAYILGDLAEDGRILPPDAADR